MSDVNNVAVPANNFPFQEFCKLLEELFEINNTKIKFKKNKQTEVLKQFVEDFRLRAAQVKGTKDCTFFPILRLLLPDLERERGAYNIKEAKLGQLLVKVLSLHKQSIDAQRLINFRAVGNNKHGSDLPSVACFILKNRVQGTDCLTIKDINDALDKIANASGDSGKTLDEVFTHIIKSTTAIQQKWFLRIVLKDLKIGIGRKRLLSAYHPDAVDHYDTYNSILKVCNELDEYDVRPPELGVQVFSGISPMLSERLDLKDVGKLSQDLVYQIETKFDGERFQMHMENDKYEYFSRRGFRYAKKFGSDYSNGNLTPLLKDCFVDEVKSFILDGEMMGWHKERQCFSSKGISFDVKNITEKSKYTPCFCAFDILYYNGKTLIGSAEKKGMPLGERLKLLDKIFHDKTGVIYHSKRYIVKESSEIIDALNMANECGEEGIVVKDVMSYYIPGRRNCGWYKVKPEYTEGTMEDLDLLIIGGDYAENKRRGIIKSFMVAIADSVVPGAMPTRWLSIGYVSTGLTNDEREQLCTKLEPHWRTFNEKIPDCLIFAKKKPDLWIHPERSIVLEVRASELILSKEFATEYTLRFPRVLKIREDKPIKDTMTLEQLNYIVKDKSAVVKLSTTNVNKDMLELTAESSQRRKRQAKPLEVAEQFRAKKTCDVTPTSQTLAGKEICVLSDDDECTKSELEQIVLSHGGTVVQNYNHITFCCIYGRKNVRVLQAVDQKNLNIVSSKWLKQLPELDKPIQEPPHPIHMISMTRDVKMLFKQYYDKYGDHYTTLIDEHYLKELFNKMDENELQPIYLNTEEMLTLDEELFTNDNKYSYLRGCFIYFPVSKHRLSIRARMYGAQLCDVTSPNLTHVIVKNKNEKDDICNDNNCSNVLFVTENWLEESFIKQTYVSEDGFIL